MAAFLTLVFGCALIHGLGDKEQVLAATGGIRAVFKYWPEPHSPESARQLCSGQEMFVPSPSTSLEQNDLVGFIHKYNLTETWLDGQQYIYPWKWVDNGVPLLDQGCYGLEESRELSSPIFTMDSYMDFDRCFLACANQSYTEVGIAVDLSDGNKYFCSCGSTFDRFKLTKQSKCPEKRSCFPGKVGYCGGDPYNIRIFHVGGNISLPWAEDSTSSQLCGCLIKENDLISIRTSRCRDRRRYICSLPKRGELSNCSEVLPGKCLVAYLTSRNWFEARFECIKQGGELAYISQDMIVKLNQLGLWDEDLASSAYNYWVGLTGSHWKWTTSKKDVTYSRWDTGEPGSPFDKSCVVVTNNGKWKSTECERRKHVICVKYEPMPTSEFESSAGGDKETNSGLSVTPANAGSQGPSSKARTTGLIVGITLAGAALIALVVFLILLRRKQKKGIIQKSNGNKMNTGSLQGVNGPCPDDDDIDANYVNRPRSHLSIGSHRTSDTEVKRAVSGSSAQLERGQAEPGSRGPGGFGPNDGAGMVVNPLFDEVIEPGGESPTREVTSRDDVRAGTEGGHRSSNEMI